MILQKIIAQSGSTSRRQAEKLIKEGAVKINGRPAQVGEEGDSDKDVIAIRGKIISGLAQLVYLKLNKPRNYVCTNRRFPGEKNIFSLVNNQERLFAVGRLDKDSRGLVLLTNDGPLAQRLSHPRFQQEKVYEVKAKEVDDKNIEAILTRLRQGVDIGEDDGRARAKEAKYLQNNLFVITLNEGKKRQIRRMFKVLNMEVVDLKRTSLAGLKLGSLAEGRSAYLTKEEIKQLKI